MTGRDVQVGTDATLAAKLRRCEDLFFSLRFAELAQLCTSLIEHEGGWGDAYAYRSFARLGESEQDNAVSKSFGLVELLRDYFHARDRSLATEGAKVCRLFLKLLFADLVKKISHARPGEKFSLQRTDPLCGGMLAIFEGDFNKAEENFRRGIGEPESTMLAYAGIGLLRAINSDVAGAIEALAQAGPEDEDVCALAASLQSAKTITAG
jgi:hypothetical protein